MKETKYTGKYIYVYLSRLYDEQRELLDALNELEDSSSVFPTAIRHLTELWEKKKREVTDFEIKVFMGD
jgi:hypothetical protein